MKRARRRLRRLGTALVGTLLAAVVAGSVAAQGWTVQTMALRDLDEAEARISELVELGFDAYSEFAMSDGRQYVRVRVGCYARRAGAEALAATMRGAYTAEAVAVELSVEAGHRFCVRREVGFRADGWEQRAEGVAAFRVEVDGASALMRFRDGSWQVLQDGALEALPPGTEPSEGPFRPARGGAWVATEVTGRPLRVCPGRLLAQEEGAAVVALDGAVMSCHLTEVEAAP